jgi:hypothetical protein
VRRFRCFAADLSAMAKWRIDQGVRSLAMQSTGVEGRPVLEVLQQNGLEVYGVNARQTQKLPGRKSDGQERQGLLKWHRLGRRSHRFQPANEIPIARTLWRPTGNRVAEAGGAMPGRQKALAEMNIQLGNMPSDHIGVSGRKTLESHPGGGAGFLEIGRLGYDRR